MAITMLERWVTMPGWAKKNGVGTSARSTHEPPGDRNLSGFEKRKNPLSTPLRHAVQIRLRGAMSIARDHDLSRIDPSGRQALVEKRDRHDVPSENLAERQESIRRPRRALAQNPDRAQELPQVLEEVVHGQAQIVPPRDMLHRAGQRPSVPPLEVGEDRLEAGAISFAGRGHRANQKIGDPCERGDDNHRS